MLTLRLLVAALTRYAEAELRAGPGWGLRDV